MSLNDINKMPLAERLYLMEQLWDSFKQEKQEIDSPLWHRDILNYRKAKYEKEKLKTITLDELKQSYK